MHPLLCSFALLLFSVSTTLSSLADANERPRGFSIDIIHPASPILSPFYTKPDDSSFRTDLETVNFAYLMELRVGSVSTFATMDTGSNRILLNGKGCTGSACESSANTNFIEKPLSKCFQTVCEIFTRKPQVQCPCGYNFSFHDRFFTEGQLAREKFWFPISGVDGERKFNLWFGFSTHSSGAFERSSAGIVGLGPDEDFSLIGQLSRQPPRFKFKFSYCLPPNPNSFGKLRFGDQVTISVKNSIQLLLDSKKYSVRLEKISVGDDANGPVITVSDKIVIDSGTTFTYLTPNSYTAFRDLVRKEIGGQVLIPKDHPVHHTYYHDCFEHEKGKKLSVPKVLFHFSGGTTIQLKEDNFFDTFDHQNNNKLEWLCLTVVQGPINVLGSRAQRGFDVVIDVTQQKVSFDPDPDCSKQNA